MRSNYVIERTTGDMRMSIPAHKMYIGEIARLMEDQISTGSRAGDLILRTFYCWINLDRPEARWPDYPTFRVMTLGPGETFVIKITEPYKVSI